MRRLAWLLTLAGAWLTPVLATAATSAEPAPVAAVSTELPLLVLHSAKHSDPGQMRTTPTIARLVETLGQRAQLRFRLLPTPWNRAVTMALAGEAGIYGLSKTEQRTARLRFSERVWREEVLLVTRRDRQFDFRGIEDLRGKRVSVPLGTSYDDAFEQAKHSIFSVDENPGGVQARLKQLLAGRTDVAVYGNGRDKLAQQLAKLRDGEQLVALAKPLTFNDRYFAFPPQLIDAASLARLDQAIRQTRDNGEIERWLATADVESRADATAKN